MCVFIGVNGIKTSVYIAESLSLPHLLTHRRRAQLQTQRRNELLLCLHLGLACCLMASDALLVVSLTVLAPVAVTVGIHAADDGDFKCV